MDGGLTRRVAARPRRLSAAAAEAGANASPQDGEVMEVHPARNVPPGSDRQSAAAGVMERRSSATQVTQAIHQRHMPIDPLKFHIPKKTKEKRALFHYVSTESREYEDMLTILTSGYIDTGSTGSFTYSQPRLVHSELLEKEFVEKRREMKADGRTDKELEESYCFLLADSVKREGLTSRLTPILTRMRSLTQRQRILLKRMISSRILVPLLCEKGLLLGSSRVTALGNPAKGVYLSRYSDLIQSTPLAPGSMGEIIIFKVMKGKVKSIYENMKNLLDPVPRFDSHISKNASKVTSINTYRAFELTQHYFYEYLFDELRERPRQVCPYAVVSFQFKGKDSPLPGKAVTPNRMNSQSSEGSKERAQFTVWNGDLVRDNRILFQISLCSSPLPFLPHRLPEKLQIGCLMRLNKVTKLLPSDLFSYNLYSSSQEVVKGGHCCSLLEVIDRFRSTTSVTKLLQELEKNRVVLVTPLTERGFLFLLSSVQMATPPERGENWKRCLQALFIFPETRDVSRTAVRHTSTSHDASVPSASGSQVILKLNQFIPALHHALVKARANPPPELSTGVERQARDYLVGLRDGKVRQYPMGEYESTLDEQGAPAPKHQRVNMDGYLRSYLFSPGLYRLSVARVQQMVQAHCSLEEPAEAKMKRSSRDPRGAAARETTSNTKDGNTAKLQNLVDLVLNCKRNAETQVRKEEAGQVKTPGRKRRLEQETAERAIKLLKASQEPGQQGKIQVVGNSTPTPAGSLMSVIGSLGLGDLDLRDDGSELSASLHSLLTGLNQAARGTASQSPGDIQEEGQGNLFPFDKLATKLGLPTNCDIDLRRQDELEEQMAGSISSLEGFSPGSHSGETNHLRARAGGYEELEEDWEIPWILIPITGLSSQRYTQRDRNIPQDPRFQHLTTTTSFPPTASVATTTKPLRKSPTPPPEPSLSSSPSPPPSPYQCLSPDPSPPAYPSQCPSPEPSPPPSPSQCPSPQPSPPASPSQCPSPHLSPPSSPVRCQSPEPNEISWSETQSGVNEERLAPAASRESTGVSEEREEKPQWAEEKPKAPSVPSSVPSSVRPSFAPTLERLKNLLKAPAERAKEAERETVEVRGGDEGVLGRKEETQVPVEMDEQEEEAEEEAEDDVEVMQVEQEGAAQEVTAFPPDTSSPPPPPPPLRGIDGIVDKHLGDFSSDMQLLLQGESIHYSFPQSPDSNTEPAAPLHAPIAQFSQYVTFYNPRPPVHDYVSSLQDGLSSMLAQLDDSRASTKPATTQTTTDVSLETTVSAFVSSIRAANGRDEDELMDADSGGAPWQPLTITKMDSDDTNRHSPTFHVTLSNSTSASGSAGTPSPPLEITRTVANDLRDDPDSSTRTVHSTTAPECPDFKGTLPGYSDVSSSVIEPSPPSEPRSSPCSEPVPDPGPVSTTSSAALSSFISQLQPEVFKSLVEIIKDVKRNSLQFYLHSNEPGDLVYQGIKDQLLKQGHIQLQSPETFLNQENSDNRLLVIIKNKDISANVHKIPGLVSLKRHPSVVFMGIDTPDDVINNSFNELFVSGGCIVSDELVLNPDHITHNRLEALLRVLEQQSSPDNLWRWKVHFKTHKKLKEQARFRRDAANLLDLLSAYQKRQIVEFLPYHNCDMINQHSPELQCLLELQARYTLFRHTVFLSARHAEELHAYSDVGVIMAGIDDILHDFPRLVSHFDAKDKELITEQIQDYKDLIHPVSSIDQPHHHLPHQPTSSLPPPSHRSDQLVPDVLPQSTRDLEVLRQAISQLRAERQAQLQQLQLMQQQRLDAKSLQSPAVSRALTGSSLPKSLPGHSEQLQKSPGKTAVAATLDLIHSDLHPEEEEEEVERREEGAGWRTVGEQGGGLPVRAPGVLGGNLSLSETPAHLSNQNLAAGHRTANQKDLTNSGREMMNQQREQGGAASCSTEGGPVGGARSRKTPEPSIREGAAEITSDVTGSIDTRNEPKNNVDTPAGPSVQEPTSSLLGPTELHEQAVRLMMSRAPGFQAPPRLTSLGGIQSLLGPTPVWTGGMVWGLQQGGRALPGNGLLGAYHNAARPGGSWYRGGQRGGGFSRM